MQLRPILALSFLLAVAAATVGCSSSSAPPANVPKAEIAWQPWSDDVFARAQKENKFVLLDLGAVWCHWCHVMEETTYRDPEVVRLINEKYIPVQVDQDSRPDLSNRYEDYGWPATIVFNEKGGEIVKRRGYLPPRMMAALLKAIIADPTPGPSVEQSKAPTAAASAALGETLRKELDSRVTGAYDHARGGWGTGGHKYLHWDNVEYCLVRANEEPYRQMARQTLTMQLKLLDPVWGGVYQYSTDGDWDHAHFEKLLQFQAENLRVYAQAYAAWGDKDDLAAARKIQQYLRDFLMDPSGAFYVSQDADLVRGEHSEEYFKLDDAGRRKLGIPRVDKHLYARENGWAIAGLCALYNATGDAATLADAVRAARWVIENRTIADGGFGHDETDAAGPYLGDTLAMARAFLALYTSTGDRYWLERATRAAAFIDARFRAPVGVVTAATSAAAALPPAPQMDENIGVARFANLLYHHTNDKKHRALAEHAMSYLAAPELTKTRGFGVGGILLADRELATEPLHASIVGPQDDPRSRELVRAALGYFDQYKRVDRVDPKGPPTLGSEIGYPPLTAPAAFICANGACSSPMTDPKVLTTKMNRK